MQSSPTQIIAEHLCATPLHLLEVMPDANICLLGCFVQRNAQTGFWNAVVMLELPDVHLRVDLEAAQPHLHHMETHRCI